MECENHSSCTYEHVHSFLNRHRLSKYIADLAVKHGSMKKILIDLKTPDQWLVDSGDRQTLPGVLFTHLANVTLQAIAKSMNGGAKQTKDSQYVAKAHPFFDLDSSRYLQCLRRMWASPAVHSPADNGNITIPDALYFFTALGPPPFLDVPQIAFETPAALEAQTVSETLAIQKSDTHGLGVFTRKEVSGGDVLFECQIRDIGDFSQGPVDEAGLSLIPRIIPFMHDGARESFLTCEGSRAGALVSSINHSADDNIKVTATGTGALVISATKDISKGSECYITYPISLLSMILFGVHADEEIARFSMKLEKDCNLSGSFVNDSDSVDTMNERLFRALIPGNAELDNKQKQLCTRFWNGKGPHILQHSGTGRPIGPRYRIDQHGTPHDPATVKDQPSRYLTHLLSPAEVRKITHRLSWTKCLDAKALGIKCITSDDGEGH